MTKDIKSIEVIESELKRKMALQCVHSLKGYARHKEANTKSKPLRTLLRRLILLNSFEYEYAFLISILFAVEFETIKLQVKNNTLSFKHLESEHYWNEVGHNIHSVDALFFSYTYFSEIYPNIIDTVVEIEKKQEEMIAKEPDKNPSHVFVGLICEHLK